MSPPESALLAGPSATVRRLVSLALVIHFFAILTAITSCSELNFPAPLLAVWANEPLRPYLQFTFLNNAYRFFSPNPGAPTVLWFRIQYEDQTVRWIELPGQQDSWVRIPYQRRLNFSVMFGPQLLPAAVEGGSRQLTEIGRITAASCARHVAKTQVRRNSDGSRTAVKSVGVYAAQHAVLTPEQVRAGWVATDLPTYHAVFVGAFNQDGDRTDEFRSGVMEQPISFVAAGILEVDLYPLLRQQRGSDCLKLADDLGLPTPVRRLLDKYPELRVPSTAPDELKSRIEQLLAASNGSSAGDRP